MSGSEPEECSRIDTRMSQPAIFRFRNKGIPVTTTTPWRNTSTKRKQTPRICSYPNLPAQIHFQDASKIVNTGKKRYRFTSRREGSTRESKKSQVGIASKTEKLNTSNIPKRPISERLASTGAGIQRWVFSSLHTPTGGNVAMAAPHKR